MFSHSRTRMRHNFEAAHFEHDRVDVVAMERLTASPHVRTFDECFIDSAVQVSDIFF